MRAYMAHSRAMGSWEGAILVFANNSKEAKKIAWKSGLLQEICGSDYLDVQLRWLRNEPWVFQNKKSDDPHYVESPISCKQCGFWGLELNEDGICEGCAEENEELKSYGN